MHPTIFCWRNLPPILEFIHYASDQFHSVLMIDIQGQPSRMSTKGITLGPGPEYSGGYQSLSLGCYHLAHFICCFIACIEHCSTWPIPFLSIHVLVLDFWLHTDSLSFAFIPNPFPTYTGLLHVCFFSSIITCLLVYPLFEVIPQPLSIIKQVFTQKVSKP